MVIPHSIVTHFRTAVESLSDILSEKIGSNRLRGLGFITTDDLSGIVAFYRTSIDLPADSEPYLLYSPVEWSDSQADCFNTLNLELQKFCELHNNENLEILTRSLFDTLLNILDEMNIRARFGDDLYITFGSSDPSDFMISEESRFVEQMNSPEIHSVWEEEFGIN